MSSSAASSPSQSSFDAQYSQGLPTLITFLHNVPPQLTVLLAELGPTIGTLRRLAEVASWKSDYANSWMLLAVWWTLCLFSEFTFRYLLIFIIAILYIYLSSIPQSLQRPPATEQSLQSTVIDLSVLEGLSPSLPRPKPLPLDVILRVLGLIYVPFLALTYFIRLKIILGAIGTVVLTWRARWACTARTVIWRSAWFRRGLAFLWARLSGQPVQRIPLTNANILNVREKSHSVHFLITIYENQRWWVGLDWTSALLPAERPPWCSAAQDPVSAPSSFSLPAPTCAYLGDGKGGLLKHTASWKWGEGEWKVVVKKEMGTKRVEKELPVMKEDLTPHANRVGKAKLKVHEASLKLKSQHDGDTKDVSSVNSSSQDEDAEHNSSMGQDEDEDDDLTDNDGWVYGDNKWKGTSSSGGLGKYTRFRKWTRIAVLTEVVEPASAEEARAHAAQLQASAASGKLPDDRGENGTNDDKLNRSISRESNDDDNDRQDGGIRKRLKAAIKKSATIGG